MKTSLYFIILNLFINVQNVKALSFTWNALNLDSKYKLEHDSGNDTTKNIKKAKRKIASSDFTEHFDKLPLSEFWLYELQDDSRIKICKTNSKKGNSLEVSLYPKDYVSRGNRSEIKIYPGDSAGSEVIVKYSVLFPKDFQSIENEFDGSHLINQFHEQPPKGLKFSEFKDETERNLKPSISVHYLKIDNKDYLCLYYGNEGVFKKEEKKRKLVALTEIEKEKWYDIKLHIKYSLEDDGFIEAWLNGKPWSKDDITSKIRVYGANMTNSTPLNI